MLMDIHIKGKKSGVELSQQLMQQYSFPIIFVSAFADRKTFEEALQTQPYAYLTKPFKDADIQNAIEIAIQKGVQVRNQEPYKALLNQFLNKGVMVFDKNLMIKFTNTLAEQHIQQITAQGKAITLFLPDILSLFNKEEPSLVSVFNAQKQEQKLYGQVFNLEEDYALFLSEEVEPITHFIPHTNVSLTYQDIIFVKDRNKMVSVKVCEIQWLEAVDNYTFICIQEQKKIMVNVNLKSLLSQLPETHFVRVHRSYAVAIHAITKIEEGHVFIEQQSIPIGKNYKNDFLAKINIL